MAGRGRGAAAPMPAPGAIRAASILGDGSPMPVNPDYFTGRTVLSDLTGALGATGCRVYHVRFSAGSMTKVHVHTGGQMLLATRGTGVLSYYRKRGRGARSFAIEPDGTVALSPGTAAYIPAGRLHSHGSAPGSRAPFSHTAVNLAEAGGGAEMRTTWYESDFEGRVTGIVG